MLVLSRKSGESIVISDREGAILAKIKVVKNTEKFGATLGIDALEEIHVDREEIYRSKKSSNTFN